MNACYQPGQSTIIEPQLHVNWPQGPREVFHLTLDFSFLILCASSMTMYLQANFLKTAFSLITIS